MEAMCIHVGQFIHEVPLPRMKRYTKSSLEILSRSVDPYKGVNQQIESLNSGQNQNGNGTLKREMEATCTVCTNSIHDNVE